MQIFELHFNPKKEEKFFDSFVYEPESTYEKKLGNLYIAGELKNSLPSNSKLLGNLAQNIKKNYYTLSAKSAEKALTNASKKANHFLSEQIKKENVDWLGNLNLAIVSINKYDITFTKTGDIKILLLRGGHIVDAGANLDLEEIEPYPLKIFFNVVSGKLMEDDKVLIITKEVYDFLQESNVINKLARVENLNSKNIKQILPPSLFNKEEGLKISGICLINVLTKDSKKNAPILFQGKKALLKMPKFHLPKVNLPKIKFSKIKLPKVKLPKVKLPKIKNPLKRIPIKKTSPIIERFKKEKHLNKKLILVIALVAIIFLAIYLFRDNSQPEQISLEEIKQRIEQIDSILIIGNYSEANTLLKEIYQELSLLPETQEVNELKQSVESKLYEINKLEIIDNPEIALELNYNETDIEHLKKLYSFTDTDIFFSSSAVFKYNKEWQSKDINVPFSNYSFEPYSSSLYFLNKDNCQIIKYPYSGGIKWSSPTTWLKQDSCSNPQDIAIDGSIWILSNNNLLRYYNQELRETITIDIFPTLEEASIKTKYGLLYIYILEQANNRLIIIDKSGNIVKQIKSDKFNKLKEFDISSNGNTIYILNDFTIYKLNI